MSENTAEVVTEWPKDHKSQNGQSKYDRWLDGQIWKVDRGVFRCAAPVLRTALSRRAAARRLRCRVSVSDKYVYIHATPLEPKA